MSTRIPVAWVLFLIIVAVFAFFGYHIVQAANIDEKRETYLQSPHMYADSLASQASQQIPPRYMRELPEAQMEENLPAPNGPKLTPAEASARDPPAPKPMPQVPAQTEEDLRSSEQIQATPPTTQYDPPEAIDPMNRMVHMGAEFGSNLRHPEQMIERRPSAGVAGIIPSGLGSADSNPGGNRSQMYTPEMAQNGGEFMNGIFAFDRSETGVAYSII